MIGTIIVTGATGFVGRWFVNECLQQNKKVLAIVRPNSSNIIMLPENDNLTIVSCEMCEYKKLPEIIDRKLITGDALFYHLSWAGVSGDLRFDVETQLANIKATKYAVEAAAALGCTRFVGLGSIMEYEAIASAEQQELKPSLGYIYGEAKHYAHLMTKALCAKLEVQQVWAMITNAYGEYEYSPRFINTTLRKMIRKEPLEFTAGTQIYDFVHVKDVCRALLLIGEKGKAYSNYMIGSGKAQPLRNFIELMGKTLAPEQKLQFGDIPYTGAQIGLEVFSNRKLIEDTGFEITIPFEEGITNLMEWLRKNE